MKRKVNDLIKDIYIPKNSIILLHVRLKNLFDIKYDYADLSRSIYDAIENKFSPVEILVPSYTYSFTKSRIFDYRKSKSEVGRFSEEIRILNDPNKRTKDPVFSIISTKNFFIKQNLDNSSAFGSNSTWDILGKLGHYTININLTEPIVTTYLHKLEFDYKLIQLIFFKDQSTTCFILSVNFIDGSHPNFFIFSPEREYLRS